MFNPHTNPHVPGDRVRVVAGPANVLGKIGTVETASRMCLGIPNDFNTGVKLDDWPHDGMPIFNDEALEKIT